MWLLWVMLGIGVIAAMSAGLALGLHLVAPRMSATRRVLIASGMAAALPMSVAIGGFLTDVDRLDGDFWVSFAALVLAFFVILSVCCLPPAWWATQRLARSGGAVPQVEADEPELIEG
ncbi:MAG: hypothetical protein KDE15_15190 [Erythrobacter sp.]|nr:hypothetical protein [Erythrobacter sp.]